MWSCSINLSLATGILFHFLQLKNLPFIIIFLIFFFFVGCSVVLFWVCFFFPWGVKSSIWCQQKIIREIGFVNPWPMYWKIEHGSAAAITGICCGHLAWSLHNLWHQASEEIAFSISFWHFSSWQAYRILLEPKVKCNKLCTALPKKKKKSKHKQGQFRLPSQAATGVGNRNTWL